MRALHWLVAAVLFLAPSGAWAAAVFFGPVLYQQRSQSPFYEGIQAGSIFLEDFEDGLQNTPNVTVRGGFLSPQDHGVDEDDGVIDGIGDNNIWHQLPIFPNPMEPWNFEISFHADGNGEYPKFAGFAMLGSAPLFAPGDLYSLWWAFDPTGNPLSAEPMRVDFIRLADHTYYNTKGDQFVGVYNEAGIGRILIDRNPLLDHLQYGNAVPEPSAWVLGLTGALAFGCRRRPSG